MSDRNIASLRAADAGVPTDIGMVCPTAPARIWLQVDPEPEEGGNPVYPPNPSHDDVTWCADRINETDTLYIRADQQDWVNPETLHMAEDADALHLCLDNAGVPRADESGTVFSLWGRVLRFRDVASPAVAPSAQQPQAAGVSERDLPPLPQSLLDAIGEYGMARTDGVGEVERLHHWEVLIAGIKRYARSLLSSTSAPAQAEQAHQETKEQLNEGSRTKAPAMGLAVAMGVEHLPCPGEALGADAAAEGAKAIARLMWLHSPASHNVDGWEWGIFRVRWQHGNVCEALQTGSDFADLDAAMLATSSSSAVQGEAAQQPPAPAAPGVPADAGREEQR